MEINCYCCAPAALSTAKHPPVRIGWGPDGPQKWSSRGGVQTNPCPRRNRSYGSRRGYHQFHNPAVLSLVKGSSYSLCPAVSLNS